MMFDLGHAQLHVFESETSGTKQHNLHKVQLMHKPEGRVLWIEGTLFRLRLGFGLNLTSLTKLTRSAK